MFMNVNLIIKLINSYELIKLIKMIMIINNSFYVIMLYTGGGWVETPPPITVNCFGSTEIRNKVLHKFIIHSFNHSFIYF